jgi:hypothetical protein
MLNTPDLPYIPTVTRSAGEQAVRSMSCLVRSHTADPPPKGDPPKCPPPPNIKLLNCNTLHLKLTSTGSTMRSPQSFVSGSSFTKAALSALKKWWRWWRLVDFTSKRLQRWRAHCNSQLLKR